MELRPHLSEFDECDFDIKLPTPHEEKHIDSLCNKFAELNNVTKALQRSNITMSEVRSLFDQVIEEFPITEFRLGPKAKTVHQPEFEWAIIKIQDERTTELSQDEMKAVHNLKIIKSR